MAANSDVLDLLEKKIEEGLKAKRLSKSERLSLEVQQLFVLYMKDDHPKTQTMWQVFKPAAWLLLVFLTSFIGLIAMGKVEVFIR